MTEPTYDELAKLFTEETGFDVDDFPAAILGFARAVLQRWGQPSGAGEPVARIEIGRTKGGISLTHIAEPAAFQLPEGMYALYTTPQPTHAVPPAGREPLTDEWIRSRCKEPWVFETAKQWVRITEQHHGITGGQHGDDI